MAKIDCSVTVNFLVEHNRMCEYNISHDKCYECPMYSSNNGTGYSCKSVSIKAPNRAIEIVQEWSDEHPQKTRLDDLLEKYPKVSLNGDGTPRFDPWMLGYCDKCCDCSHCIGDDYCWNEPVDGGATGKAVK